MIKRILFITLWITAPLTATPLNDAINKGNVAEVQKQARLYANANKNRDWYYNTIDYSYPGTTYIMAALKNKNLAVMQELLKKE